MKNPTSEKTPTTQTTSLRHPDWTYFHLSLFSTIESEPKLDLITARQYITSALSRFLGLTGAAIPVDMLKLDGSELWLRVPRGDSLAFHEAVSSWVGTSSKWIVKGKDDWLLKLVAGDGQDLFE